MRQIERYILNGLAALSLLLLFSGALLWLRSGTYDDVLLVTGDSCQLGFKSRDGSLTCFRRTPPPTHAPRGTTYRADTTFPGSEWDWKDWDGPPPDPERRGFHLYGLDSQPGWYGHPWRVRGFEIPWWTILVMLSILPLRAALLLIRRIRREVQGLCVVCAYDLRAGHERCPECGTVRKQGDV